MSYYIVRKFLGLLHPLIRLIIAISGFYGRAAMFRVDRQKAFAHQIILFYEKQIANLNSIKCEESGQVAKKPKIGLLIKNRISRKFDRLCLFLMDIELRLIQFGYSISFLLISFNGLLVTIAELLTTYLEYKHVNNLPGNLLLEAVTFLYSSKTKKEVFEQIVSDWRMDYFDALKAGRKLQARYISIRETYNFLKAVAAKNPIADLIETVKKISN